MKHTNAENYLAIKMTEQESKINIDTAVILTGGASSRFGKPKGLQIINGRPLLSKIVDEIRDAGIEKIYLSTDYPALYGDFDLESIPDQHTNAGPMAGIYSALVSTNADDLLILPCDLPGITADAIRNLIHGAGEFDTNVVYAVTDSREHPLVAVVNSRIIPEIKSALDEGKHAVYRFFHEIDSKTVHFEKEEYFLNMNSPEDLKNWESVHEFE